MGQNGDETHLGTIKVPSALQSTRCLITQGTRNTGGTNQLFSFPSLDKKRLRPGRAGSNNGNKTWLTCGY